MELSYHKNWHDNAMPTRRDCRILVKSLLHDRAVVLTPEFSVNKICDQILVASVVNFENIQCNILHIAQCFYSRLWTCMCLVG